MKRFLAFRLMLLAITPLLLPHAQSAAQTLLIYRNTVYRFDLKLPPTWRGYRVSIIYCKPFSQAPCDHINPGTLRKEYAFISIKDPRSTRTHIRQDIPIMVFRKPCGSTSTTFPSARHP